jgi:hypothetical protein
MFVKIYLYFIFFRIRRKMEKRAWKRVPAKVQADFFYGKTMYTGIVTNISKKGMYIKTEMCLPSDSKFEMLLPFMDEVLKVPVKVSRSERTGSAYKGMGVEILDSFNGYMDFFNSLEVIS